MKTVDKYVKLPKVSQTKNGSRIQTKWNMVIENILIPAKKDANINV